MTPLTLEDPMIENNDDDNSCSKHHDNSCLSEIGKSTAVQSCAIDVKTASIHSKQNECHVTGGDDENSRGRMLRCLQLSTCDR